ncbi:hypothetical protein ANTQUA_LOCUS6322 [Anthophora quadrimaculata]
MRQKILISYILYEYSVFTSHALKRGPCQYRNIQIFSLERPRYHPGIRRGQEVEGPFSRSFKNRFQGFSIAKENAQRGGRSILLAGSGRCACLEELVNAAVPYKEPDYTVSISGCTRSWCLRNEWYTRNVHFRAGQVQQLSTPSWGRAHRIERKKKNGDEQEGRTDIHLARRLDVKTSVLSPY